MSRDLLTQLADYGDYCEQRQGSVAIDDIDPIEMRDPWASSAASVDTAVDSAQSEVCETWGSELTVFDLREPGESPAPRPGKRRAAVLAAAAAILLLVGVVVVSDRNDTNVATDAVSSATTPDAVPSPTTTDLVAPRTGGAAVVWTSVDGITWSRVSHDEDVFGGPNDQRMASVTVGGPGLVAVGGTGLKSPPNDQDAAVWTSVDGLAWSRVTHDETVFGGDGAQWMSDVTVGGPGLVAVGAGDTGSSQTSVSPTPEEAFGAAVWTSVDGITWSRVPHDEEVFGGALMSGVTVGGPGLVAVGGDGDAVVWTSVDGITWSRVAHDEAVFGGARNQQMMKVTVGGPGLVAVGADGARATDNSGDQVPAVWTSVNGITWSRVPPETIPTAEPDNAMWSVTAGGPGLVAVGHGWPGWIAAVWTSADGIVWSRVAHDEAVFGGGSMFDVTATDSGLVAVGTSVWTSVDGITWSQARQTDLPSGGDRWGVVVAGPGLVAVGDS